MAIKSILTQIALGEDSTHQFKVDMRNGESLAAEMVTFANSGGGTLFVGVADDGSTPGLTRTNATGLLAKAGRYGGTCIMNSTRLNALGWQDFKQQITG